MAAFRFALQASGAASPAAWRDLARKAEDLGYSTLYVPDHLDDQWAPMVAVTVAAEATTTLRVGTLVLDNDFRHPVLVAKEAATLDIVTGGRFEFGLGAGWMTTDYEQSGIPMDPPSVRVARLAESLAIIRAMWRDGSATFAGEHYQRHRGRGHSGADHAGRPAAGDRRREPARPGAGRRVRRHREHRPEPATPATSAPRWRRSRSSRSTPTGCAGPGRRRGSAPGSSSCSAGRWRCRSSRTPPRSIASLAPLFDLTPEQLAVRAARADRHGRGDHRAAARAPRGARLQLHRRARGGDGRAGPGDRRTCRHLSPRPRSVSGSSAAPSTRRMPGTSPRHAPSSRNWASTACCSSSPTIPGRSRASGWSRPRRTASRWSRPWRRRSRAPKPAGSRSTGAAPATRWTPPRRSWRKRAANPTELYLVVGADLVPELELLAPRRGPPAPGHPGHRVPAHRPGAGRSPWLAGRTGGRAPGARLQLGDP